MIARKHRFHGHGSLRFVYQNGKTVRGPSMSLKFAPNNKRTSYRLAVVVSKKVHKSAVVRNRIRRRLYELVRTQESLIAQPQDMVITVFSDVVATMSFDELTGTIRSLLELSQNQEHK